MASLIGRIFGKATSPRTQVNASSRLSSAQQAAKSPPAPSPRLKSARFGFVRAIADKVVRRQGDVRQRIDTLKQSGDITATTHFILNEMLDKFSPQEVSKFIELELDKKLKGISAEARIKGLVANLQKAHRDIPPRLEEMCTFFVKGREAASEKETQLKTELQGRIDALKAQGDDSTSEALEHVLKSFDPFEVEEFMNKWLREDEDDEDEDGSKEDSAISNTPLAQAFHQKRNELRLDWNEKNQATYDAFAKDKEINGFGNINALFAREISGHPKPEKFAATVQLASDYCILLKYLCTSENQDIVSIDKMSDDMKDKAEKIKNSSEEDRQLLRKISNSLIVPLRLGRNSNIPYWLLRDRSTSTSP